MILYLATMPTQPSDTFCRLMGQDMCVVHLLGGLFEEGNPLFGYPVHCYAQIKSINKPFVLLLKEPTGKYIAGPESLEVQHL